MQHRTEPPEFHHVVSPQLPDKIRRRLAAGRGSESSTVVLATVLALLFGLAGCAILVTGAAPRDASPVVFGAAAGGGGLLVGLLAAVVAVRGAVAQYQARAAVRAGLYLPRQVLDDLAHRNQPAGQVLARTQHAVGRIRASEAYRRGDLTAAIDEATLGRIEWTVAEALLRSDETRAGLGDLRTQVERLESLADTAETLGDVAPQNLGSTAPAAGRLADELDRSALVAEEIVQLRRNEQ